MPEPWLDIIGIGEDGEAGLSDEARATLMAAEVIIGGDRHQKLASNNDAERVSWPSPFDAMIERIKGFKGKKLVILVTGDPLWYSVGARILKAIPAEEIRFFPQLSSFQWAACRMGWSLADIETITIHGRAASQVLPHIAPGVRLIVLTKDKTSPATVCELLNSRGFGKSRMVALASLGGPNEARYEGIVENWDHEVPDFHVLAIECIAGEGSQWHSRAGGIPDDAFQHDGQLTKRLIRAATLSVLQPYPDAILWDVGAGCGSIAIEWMRSCRGARAIAIERNRERISMIEENAKQLGTEKISIVEGEAPGALKELVTPDAVFIGGGITRDGLLEACWDSLRTGGRLVANCVTLEGEAKLVGYVAKHGGELTRISVEQAQPIGEFSGWKPQMPVTQWVVTKGAGS